MAWPVFRRQCASAALFAAFGGVVALPFGRPWMGVAIATFLFLLRQLYHVAALRQWSEHPKRTTPPEPGGLWGEIFDRLVDLQRRNRKRKKRLAALLAQFQNSAEALPDGAVVMEQRGEIAWFNTAAQAFLGLRLPQDLGQRMPNLLRHPDFTGYFEREDFDREVEIPSPVNASIMLALRVIPYGTNQRLLMIRDVSELHRLERIRRDFVANASHELRTPLTVLRGYLDIIEPETRHPGPMATWSEPIAEMRKQAARMESLINDLLRLARLESEPATRPETHDVPELIDTALHGAQSLSKGQHRFERDIQDGLWLVGGEGELQSIFANLLQNAVQYTPAGGSVRLRWREAEDGGATFSVADTGIGIKAEDIPRLTERFYRVDVARSRATGGTGLGLSIVKHALDHHEARLEIDSEPGVGSTFNCHFPPHRVVRAAVAESASQSVR